MPWSKTRAGSGLNEAFKIKNNPRPGQNLVLKIDWTGAYFGPGQILVQNNTRLVQDRGYMGHFSPLKNKK